MFYVVNIFIILAIKTLGSQYDINTHSTEGLKVLRGGKIFFGTIQFKCYYIRITDMSKCVFPEGQDFVGDAKTK